jgi:MFS family permease
VRAADRRYAGLSFLQWLPVGLTMVPMVLLLLERGLTLAEVALLGLVTSVTVAAAELPTGGLADALGRRPVLVTSALVHAAGLAVLALSGRIDVLLVSSVLRGLARALASGPLDAWYVDTARAAGAVGEGALTRGLSRGQVACSVGLGAGTVLGGVLPFVLPLEPAAGLAVPVLCAAAVELLRAALTLGLDDARRASRVRAAVAGVWPAVRSGARLARTDAVLLRLLTAGAATGIALAVIELVTPAWLGELTEEPTAAALVYGALVALGFGADALGAAASVRLRDRAGSSLRGAVAAGSLATVATGLLVVAATLEGALALVLAGAAYLLVFAGLGAAGPLLAELLHGRVEDDRRATVLSVESLLFQGAGALGGLAAGVVVTAYGAAAGLAVGGAALAVGVLVLVRTARLEPSAPPFNEVENCR